MRFTTIISMLVVALTFMLGAQAAQAETVEEFYRGKTITMVFGMGNASSFSVYTTLLAKYMPKYIPGHPNLIPRYMAGSGGTRAARFMGTAAPKDGTFVGVPLPGSVLSPLFRPQIEYDSSKFQWIGSFAPLSGAAFVWEDAPATTLDRLGDVQTVMATSSKFSEAYLMPMLAARVNGWDFKYIAGYRGAGPMNMAIENKEVHGRGGYWDGILQKKQEWLPHVVVLFRWGPRVEPMPDVPTLQELMKTDEQHQMADMLTVVNYIGTAMYAPEGVPADRVEALRKAFVKTMNDPEFLADAARLKLRVEPRDGAELDALVDKAFATPKPVIEKFKELVDVQ